MTKNKTLAYHSRTADAKATRTTLPRKKHAAINASDQDLAKVSDAIIDLLVFCWFAVFGLFCLNLSGLLFLICFNDVEMVFLHNFVMN